VSTPTVTSRTGPLRILVAEDDPDTRALLSDHLARRGHAVSAVADGPQLVEAARRDRPDLVITDIKMPGLDGLQAAAEVNREYDVPVILVTGHHEADRLGRAAAPHVVAYLLKPVRPDELDAAITLGLDRFRQYLRMRQQAEDLQQALRDRKVIERAKGALMHRLRLDEDEGFRRLRRLAADDNTKLVEAARKVLEAEEVFRELERGAPPSRPEADAP
jgi:response regulator NasT